MLVPKQAFFHAPAAKEIDSTLEAFGFLKAGFTPLTASRAPFRPSYRGANLTARLNLFFCRIFLQKIAFNTKADRIPHASKT